ncbi:thiol:disulfide interchange protein DsbA/DsbL [Shewanella cyperi]|uniref:thiol:disulfide interchange protein DsbA/DsbL n=1 Tax=Shewanella cyperi TaxID=2814292 RepID=UPI001A93BB09|nr:thiol:disulfide interchange protein DsbA/DsbL [Shewanella cyperi]QSX41966.1 thiol:disulfide interchange protein DsbA/DsbL [Shewanella cyperi]
MPKRLSLAAALIALPFFGFAGDFVEGKHYIQISDQAPSKTPKVTEFFSFFCHNCFNMEVQYLPAIKAGLKSDISFDTKHVDFMNSDIGTEVMRALAVIHASERQTEMARAMFNAIQGADGAQGHHDHSAEGHSTNSKSAKSHEPQIQSRDDIKAVFAGFGIDGAQYDKLADSKEADAKLALWRQQQQEFAVQSVPSFVVNDKYMVNLQEIRTLEELSGLMNYLATEKDKVEDQGGSLGWAALGLLALAAMGRRRLA